MEGVQDLKWRKWFQQKQRINLSQPKKLYSYQGTRSIRPSKIERNKNTQQIINNESKKDTVLTKNIKSSKGKR